MFLKKVIVAGLLGKLLNAFPTGQQVQQDFCPNMPVDLAKHYVPSQVQSNTIKYPVLNEFCLDEESTTTMMSIDGVLVPLMPDAGWYTVTYGSQYTYADQIFVINNRKTSIIQLTACFCPGNVFQVFDNGTPIILTDNCNWPVPISPNCTGPNRVTDPLTCSNSPNFCNGAAILEPGYHNISVGVLNSPWGAGAAYVRVDTAAQNGNETYLNLPLVPLCEMNGQYTCNTQIVE